MFSIRHRFISSLQYKLGINRFLAISYNSMVVVPSIYLDFLVTLFKQSICNLASDIITKKMLQYLLDSVKCQHSERRLHDVSH